MNSKFLTLITNNIIEKETKFFIKVKYKKTFYLGPGGSLFNHPYYFDYKTIAEDALDSFLGGLTFIEISNGKSFQDMMKKIKIHSRSEAKSKWSKLKSTKLKRYLNFEEI